MEEEDKCKGLPTASNASLVLPRTAGMPWKKTFPGLNWGVGVGVVAGTNTARQRGSENGHCLLPCPHHLTQVLYLQLPRLIGGTGEIPRSKGEV